MTMSTRTYKYTMMAGLFAAAACMTGISWAGSLELMEHRVEWSGSMPVQTHTGTIDPKGVDAAVDGDGNLKHLRVELDMTTIKNLS